MSDSRTKQLKADRLIEMIAAELAARTPRRADADSFEAEAAVCLMLRPAGKGGGLEFLAIERAVSARDPWSGHMALPGGHRDPADEDLWATAKRETLEEVGIDVARAGSLLGQLDDIAPRARRIPSIAITPFVVAVGANLEASESREVQNTIWVPVGALLEERYQGRLTLGSAAERSFPTIDYKGYVIWGLTYSVLLQLEPVLRSIGYPLSLDG